MRKKVTLISMVLGGFLLFTGASALSNQEHDGEKLVNEHCSQCHNLERVEIARTMKDKKAWEKTVDSMISKKPGLLDAAERDAVVDFLVQD